METGSATIRIRYLIDTRRDFICVRKRLIDLVDGAWKTSSEVHLEDFVQLESGSWKDGILSREALKSIPIIAFSCYDLTRFKQRAMRAGMADFVPKPVDRVRLLSAINDQLRLRRRLSQMSAVETELHEPPAL